jgi:hypothetical protein
MRRVTFTQRLARHLRRVARFLFPAPQSRRSGPLPTGAHPLTGPVSATVRRRARQKAALTLLFAAAWSASAQAAVIYVDSRIGADRFDGLASTQVSDTTGPVRTLRRALHLVRAGDQVHLVNNGTPYSGGVSLTGTLQSGTTNFPIEIVGNGSVVTGAKPIEPAAWQEVAEDVWRITPERKGWYQLVLGKAAVPEVPCPADAPNRPDLTPGTWCAWRGAIYYRAPEGKNVRDLDLQLADEQTGLTLLAVHNLVVRDVTFRHFQQDGIHLADRCRNVVLDNVTSAENGRAGVVVRGTSEALLHQSNVAGNRVASVLVQDLGRVEVREGQIAPEPTVVP